MEQVTKIALAKVSVVCYHAGASRGATGVIFTHENRTYRESKAHS